MTIMMGQFRAFYWKGNFVLELTEWPGRFPCSRIVAILHKASKPRN